MPTYEDAHAVVDEQRIVQDCAHVHSPGEMHNPRNVPVLGWMRLRQAAGFYLGDSLYRCVLTLTGESDE